MAARLPATVLRVFLARSAPVALLVASSFLFRLPRLLNAAALHSDAAIVGLQARHILEGEWSPFLHGSHYQTSVDATIAAFWFLLLGSSPLVLVLSTLITHVFLTMLVYGTLRRHLPPWTALLGSMPLVLTPSPVHTYVLSPPREASLALTFLAIWLLDGASNTRRPHAALAGGGVLATFAVFADPYALLLAPVALVVGVLACRDGTPGWPTMLRRAFWVTAGALAGVIPYALLVRSGTYNAAHSAIGTAGIAANAGLLWHECLPWLLSLKVYLAYPGHAHTPWQPGLPFSIVQYAGAAGFLGSFVAAAVLALKRAVPWKLRRLGLAAAVSLPLTLAGFLVSKMVFDLFAARYLAAVVLFSPFAFGVVASQIKTKHFALVIAPYLMAAAAGGWVAFGDETCGLLPVRVQDGTAEREQALAARIVKLGADVGIGDYWTAYRFAFLTNETVALIPWHRHQDRYPKYRERLSRSVRFAYVYDDERSWENFASSSRELEARARRVEQVDMGPLHAVVYEGEVPADF